jgi:hypothetical protein
VCHNRASRLLLESRFANPGLSALDALIGRSRFIRPPYVGPLYAIGFCRVTVQESRVSPTTAGVPLCLSPTVRFGSVNRVISHYPTALCRVSLPKTSVSPTTAGVPLCQSGVRSPDYYKRARPPASCMRPWACIGRSKFSLELLRCIEVYFLGVANAADKPHHSFQGYRALETCGSTLSSIQLRARGLFRLGDGRRCGVLDLPRIPKRARKPTRRAS